VDGACGFAGSRFRDRNRRRRRRNVAGRLEVVAAGKLEEAEAKFAEAVKLNPTFDDRMERLGGRNSTGKIG